MDDFPTTVLFGTSETRSGWNPDEPPVETAQRKPELATIEGAVGEKPPGNVPSWASPPGWRNLQRLNNQPSCVSMCFALCKSVVKPRRHKQISIDCQKPLPSHICKSHFMPKGSSLWSSMAWKILHLYSSTIWNWQLPLRGFPAARQVCQQPKPRCFPLVILPCSHSPTSWVWSLANLKGQFETPKFHGIWATSIFWLA